jgi:hypothetical protein
MDRNSIEEITRTAVIIIIIVITIVGLVCYFTGRMNA